MRILRILTLSALSLFGAALAGAQEAAIPYGRDGVAVAPRVDAEPAAPAGSSFVLNSAEAWASTGVTVATGDQLQIAAEGRWAAVSGQQATAFVRTNDTGPDGYPETAGSEGLLLASANRGALIGRIGQNGAPFLIGSAYRGEARGDGVLFVSMNEPAQLFGDNAGRLALRITRTPAPVVEPEPAPVEDDTTQAVDVDPPIETATPVPSPASEPSRTNGAIPPTVIAAAAVGGLLALWLIGSALFGARPSARRPASESEPPPGAVSVRVITSGEAQEALTMSMRRAS
jgi:hypothetical protein